MSPPTFENTGTYILYKLTRNRDKFYVGKTNRNLKSRSVEDTSEIQFEKTTPNSSFAKRVLENNRNINFDVNKD